MTNTTEFTCCFLGLCKKRVSQDKWTEQARKFE